jgi:hypothetical protein
MPFSFPASPTIGQTGAQNQRTYQWDGYAWTLVANVVSHASSHASGGSDAVSIAASQITSGTIDIAREPYHPFL